MQIRDIRLEQFGAWEHVDIPQLSPGVNVLFLDDGARAIDFSRFLYGMLVGFGETRGQTNAGSITFVDPEENATYRLDRYARRDGQQSWQVQVDQQPPTPSTSTLRKIHGFHSSEEIERLFIPTTTGGEKNNQLRDRWRWLGQQPGLVNELIPPQASSTSPTSHPFLQTTAKISLKPHGRVLMELGQDRDELIERIANCRADIERLQAELLNARVVTKNANQAVETAAKAEKAIRRTKPPKSAKLKTTSKKIEVQVPPAQTPVPVAPEPKQTPSPPKTTQPTVDRDLIADLSEELRRVRLQLPVLQRAAELTDRWHEYKRLLTSKNVNSRLDDLDALKNTLSEYQLLEEEKQDFQKTLAKQSRRPKESARPKRRRKRSDEHTVRRLLDQRSWVTELAATPTVAAFDVTNQQHDEVRHAAHLLINARRDQRQAQRRLTEFSKRTQFDWSRLFEDPIAATKSSIAATSPIHSEPPEKRLAELKRRRVWVREELHCLKNRQGMPLAITWIGILFTLSLCAILGTLLVNSLGGQWLTLALGMAGIVTSGALKLSLELRNSRRLNRAEERLHQIDAEILSLAERNLTAKQDAAVIRRIAAERLHAMQLHQAATESDLRLDGAEASYRELLDELGLPLGLVPEEIDRTLRGREGKPDQLPGERQGGHAKLRKWIKRARDTVERIDGVRPGKDPIELLATLESVFDYLRDQEHAADRKTSQDHERVRQEASKFEQRLQREAREQMKSLERRQNSLLKRARVDDQFALERAIEMAEAAKERGRKLQRLRNELESNINLHEDPDELRDILETSDAETLRVRYAEAVRRRDELTQKLDVAQNAATVAIANVSVEPVEPVARTLAQTVAIDSPGIETQNELNEPQPVIDDQLVTDSPTDVTPELVEEFPDEELQKQLIGKHKRAKSKHQSAKRAESKLQTQRDGLQQKLDAMRLQLVVLESKLRTAMTWSQQSATLRQIARTMLNKRKPASKPSCLPFLHELTHGRWNTLAATPAGVTLRSLADGSLADGSLVGAEELVDSHPDSEAGWLSVQIATALARQQAGHSLPLVLLADQILNTPDATRRFEVLQAAATLGVQSLLLTTDPQLANQLADDGSPTVRIGLREQSLRIADFAEHDRQLVG